MQRQTAAPHDDPRPPAHKTRDSQYEQHKRANAVRFPAGGSGEQIVVQIE
jgi:hypothetical protein